jgi:NDP-sugar pyrophosphorylase family protein
MKAMIFAAGMGTRLQQHTTDKPKALVEVAGKTLLQRAIERVSNAGYRDIVVNVHHFADQIIDFLDANNNFGVNISISDEREQLLDTGGAILKAAPLLKSEEPILIYNVDVLSDIDLNTLREYHIKQNALATLVVRKRETSRYLIFDNEMILSGWINIDTKEEKIARETNDKNLFAFSGIHIIDPSIILKITEKGKFPIIPLYLRLARENMIVAYNDSSKIWMDLGKPEQLERARILFKNKSTNLQ